MRLTKIKTKSGEAVWGMCLKCSGLFKYTYYRRPRTVCDECQGVANGQGGTPAAGSKLYRKGQSS